MSEIVLVTVVYILITTKITLNRRDLEREKVFLALEVEALFRPM